MVKNNYFTGKVGDYDLIETEDGSVTLFSTAYNEACHSTSGARAETYYNYFVMSGVQDNHTKTPFNILEVGFGLGLGYLVTVEEIMKLNSQWTGTFYSLEIDPKLIEYAQGAQNFPENCPYPTYNDLKPTYKDEYLEVYEATKNGVTLKVLTGNATKTLDIAIEKGIIELSSIDSIFQDAFSPKRNPDLWTEEWFNRLAKLAQDKAILSTYSASQSIRIKIKDAGFEVINHKGFGPKRSMTQAIRHK
jgi:tRNA U34 5-methylaminomethyl-2-thiouridine-forming methyltransferase MnmC